jgi:type II secretory pathway pseudopilin PulG
MRVSNPNRASRVPVGFTLIELIVVVSVLLIAIGILMPSMSRMTVTNRQGAAVDAINTAVTTARAYSTQGKADLEDLPGLDPEFATASYSGTAVVFTPAGEMRIVENDQTALSTGNNALEATDTTSTVAGDHLNGYVDIAALDYIRLPKGIGVVGISRSSGAGPDFLPPPFAIRFTEEGYLISDANLTADDPRMVYYDGNYDNQFRVSTGSGEHRGNPYNGAPYDIDEWDPESSEFISTNYDAVANRYKLPYEKMEAVVGVLVYSKAAFTQAGLNWGTSSTTDINGWLGVADASGRLVNAKPLFFSKYSGTVVKDR